MGALHAGHTALIQHAAAIADGRPVIVSVFVNPTQFAPGEDLDRYPRSLERDVAMTEAAGGTVVFTPSVKTMYPDGIPDRFAPLPKVARRPGLEDAHRPHFFHGVCLAVKRLFDLVQPSAAVFGEKDYQQLLVVREMVHLLAMNIEIVSVPTVREDDGLAMSSRNRYLSTSERSSALSLWAALRAANGKATITEAEQAMMDELAPVDAVDYAVIRDARTLLPVDDEPEPSVPLRALIAAQVGPARLIDNQVVRLTNT